AHALVLKVVGGAVGGRLEVGERHLLVVDDEADALGHRVDRVLEQVGDVEGHVRSVPLRPPSVLVAAGGPARDGSPSPPPGQTGKRASMGWLILIGGALTPSQVPNARRPSRGR